MSKVNRNGNIEILRFVFSVLIVLLHFEVSVFNGKLFTASYLGVEFFFIVTGVFLGKKLKAEKDSHLTEPIGTAAKAGVEFVWKRICSIFPYYFLASVLGFGIQIFIGMHHITDVFCFVGDLGFLRLLGLPCVSATGTMWYLCALFFALMLIYPFARKYYDAFVYSFAMLFPPFIIGLIINRFGDLDAITENLNGVFSFGILRAASMICIGLVVNELTDRVKELPTNRKNRFVFTACELVLYPALFVYLAFVTRSKFDYLVVVLMAFLLIVTLSGKSRLYGKFDNRFSVFLGKSSMILFMCHYFWVNRICSYSKYLPAALQKGTLTDVVLGFALTAVTSVTVYWGGNLLRFLFRKAKAALFAPPKSAA